MQLILPALIVICAVVLFFLAYRLREREAKIKKIEARLHRHSVKTMELVHQNSERLMQESIQKATEIIHDTQAVKEESEEKLQNVLHQTAKKHAGLLEKQLFEVSESFDTEFENLEKKYEKQAKKTLSQMESTGKAGLEKLEGILDKQTISLQNYLQHKVDIEFEKARSEIAQYKKAEMEKVKEDIHNLIKKTVVDVLGKSIPLDEHEKLILSALEEAKQEGIFGDA